MTSTTTYSYASNRLASASGAEPDTYAYDANANVTSIRGFTLAYDFANRLTNVNGGTVTYTYDGDGSRLKKVNAATGKTTLYHYDRASNILAETDATGAKEVEYLYINGQLVGKIVTDNVPPAIAAVGVSGVTGGTATVTWTTDEVTDSQVDYGTTTTYGSSSPLNSSLVTSHSADLTSLSPSTGYHYQVKSRDPGGNLTYSGDFTFTTLADTMPPTAPSNLTTTAVGGTQINLTWHPSSDDVGVAGYQVERCQGAGCTTFTQIATPTGTTYSDMELIPSTSYRYQVRAVDATENVSVPSNTAAATTFDTIAPSAPTGVTATAASATQINLTWTASTDDAGVTGYRVERCQGAGCSTFTQIATPTGTTYSDTGLSPFTSYSYQVKAVDAAGNVGEASPVASAMTTD
jgi:YD repeat-containing protein